jgi:hypothetical protein
VFRRIIGRETVTYDIQGRGLIGGRLSPEAVSRAFEAVARYLDLPSEEVEGISGHSMRVGASQDLLALNVDLASVMREGRWTSVRARAIGTLRWVWTYLEVTGLRAAKGNINTSDDKR